PATHFDPRVPGVSLPQGKNSFTASRGPVPRYKGNPEELAFLPVVQLARLFRTRQITSVELTRMYLERLRRYGPRLRCLVTLTEKTALEQAARADRELAAGNYRGLLHGIPWGAKDLLATREIPTTWGARPYENQVLEYDATVVKRLEAAGAVLVAKLSMGELALGDLWFGGLTRNPWAPTTGSSGSSAGPGSATAAGLVGFSIGSETHGSIVSPSIVNGVTGLRPTYGRVPRTGAMALCWTLDKLGPMCRGVEDCAAVLHAIHGPDGVDLSAQAAVPFQWNPRRPLRQFRVGVDQARFNALEASSPRRAAYEEALAVLRKQGVVLQPITLPTQSEEYRALIPVILAVESAAAFAELTESGDLDRLERQTEGAWPNTFRAGSLVPAVDYLRALRVRSRLQAEMARLFQQVDLYVTVAGEGPTMPYTNLAGHPSLVTRCGELDGKPLSIEFVGGLYQEAALLRVGLAYEQATRWHTRWPDLSRLPEELS
ncbi:MAG: amidase, partial [Armatimonadetes bacterium]|nr:amidase [Armatimonadota bacterium]